MTAERGERETALGVTSAAGEAAARGGVNVGTVGK